MLRLTDESQAQVAEYYYTAYGEIWEQTGTFAETNKYRFTGEQFDEETGFYYLRARYYDPTIGRFMTRDCESCGNRQRPLSLNKYLYGEANPVLYVDPSGHFAMLLVQNVIATALQDGLGGARQVRGELSKKTRGIIDPKSSRVWGLKLVADISAQFMPLAAHGILFELKKFCNEGEGSELTGSTVNATYCGHSCRPETRNVWFLAGGVFAGLSLPFLGVTAPPVPYYELFYPNRYGKPLYMTFEDFNGMPADAIIVGLNTLVFGGVSQTQLSMPDIHSGVTFSFGFEIGKAWFGINFLWGVMNVQ